MQKFSGLIAAALVCASASGQITAFHFDDVDNTAGGAALSTFTTTDILIDFDSRWTGSQMLITLTQGSVYQEAGVVGAAPPTLAQQAGSDSAPFDTYVTLNADSSDALPATMLAFGGAINIGGNPPLTFDTSGVDAAWVYLPPPPPVGSFFDTFQNKDGFKIARVSLSDDAEGVFKVLASAGGIISSTTGPLGEPAEPGDENQGLLVEGQILNGRFVPEPASAIAMLGLGALMLRRRG